AWMHGQDLQQPCFSECAFSPTPLQLPGVPGSAAVVQTAAAPPPPPAGARAPVGAAPGSPPANYLAEFTIGPYLYWVWGQVDATPKNKTLFQEGLKLYYQHARQQKS